jgi:hypothetical protein
MFLQITDSTSQFTYILTICVVVVRDINAKVTKSNLTDESMTGFQNLIRREFVTLKLTYETIMKVSSTANTCMYVRFQVLTAASMMFRAVFWVVLP